MVNRPAEAQRNAKPLRVRLSDRRVSDRRNSRRGGRNQVTHFSRSLLLTVRPAGMRPRRLRPADRSSNCTGRYWRHQRAWRRMLKETRVGLEGPERHVAQSRNVRRLAQHLQLLPFGKTALPQPLVELAILTTAREWSVQFEWFAHYRSPSKRDCRPQSLQTCVSASAPEHEPERP